MPIKKVPKHGRKIFEVASNLIHAVPVTRFAKERIAIFSVLKIKPALAVDKTQVIRVGNSRNFSGRLLSDELAQTYLISLVLQRSEATK